MKKLLLPVILLSAIAAPAADISRDHVQEAMKKATNFMMSISTEGGYLWKYSTDLTVRAGENMASPTQIWIQPPGTPSMGMAFLTAYKATKDTLFLEAARKTAESLVKCQLPSGGWYYAGDFDPKKTNIDGMRSFAGDQAAKGNPKVPNPLYIVATAFDDDTTQSALRFLMEYGDASKGSEDPRDKSIAQTLNKGLQGMLNAQYPNGAWPQFYDGKPRQNAGFPVKRASIPKDYPQVWPHVDYRAYYTLNDDSLRNCIQVMSEAHRRFGNPEYLASVNRAFDFILLAQLPEPQPGWAQQYTPDMVPTWARAFEPPSVVSNESRSVMELLMEKYLETGESKYIDAITRAVAWLRRSPVAPNTWARFYELNTNKPIYCKGDGKITSELSEARPGYNFQNDFHIPTFLGLYDQVSKMGREAYLAKKNSAHKRLENAKTLESKVARALEQLDEQGRWVVKDRLARNSSEQDVISTQVFIANMRTLSKYLELTQAKSSPSQEAAE